MSSSLIKSVSLQLVTALACTPAYSAEPQHDHAALRALLVQRYPGTTFGDIKATPLPGIWQIQLGAQPAYVAADGRHFLFGHLVDMETQTDLSVGAPAPPVPSTQPDFYSLPLGDAFKTVRGKGTRRMAVFADPECHYCRQLEAELDKLDNVTVYTFLLPLAALHPDAPAIAESVWCADDPQAAWRQALRGDRPPAKTCAHPLARIASFAEHHGIAGTPYIVFENGKHAVGTLNHAELERHLR
ncbi:DsbC family protein [Pseudoduganella umbonata]|uniref:Thiol:disulfide interchange protein n=1 Tax=Pseudoduganella umbonata TaxID=864828 RepID=A0A4P8HLA3_9BURK|nr:DsbC family protein [Pseudoduganella umbonata]MBB3221707.1 thiol:disulfide interchange protein DsbC [Pseudoduganella umbonata]QCP09072.1 DsbC family protein [Pseudoduganella umbonata]